jgi:hypothetical protein
VCVCLSYMADAAYRPDNSQRAGCGDGDITYCRTDSGNNDRFCKFDGTNVLTDTFTPPDNKCWFNCQMETCDGTCVPGNTRRRI